MPDDWKKVTSEAVTSATSLVASSSAAGYADVANTSLGVTYVIVNNFNFAAEPDKVPDFAWSTMDAKVKMLAAQLAEHVSAGCVASNGCPHQWQRYRPGVTRMARSSIGSPSSNGVQPLRLFRIAIHPS